MKEDVRLRNKSDAKTHRGKVCYENKKRHTEDNSPKYRMVGNDVGLESTTYRNNYGEYRKILITRSDKRRSNRINLLITIRTFYVSFLTFHLNLL